MSSPYQKAQEPAIMIDSTLIEDREFGSRIWYPLPKKKTYRCQEERRKNQEK